MAPGLAVRTSKSTAMSFNISTMLTLVVGQEPNPARFLVHEGMLCARSEFFRRAMNGNWAERDERLVKLPDDDPEVVATYINLVYTNNIATSPTEKPMEKNAILNEYIFLSKLYVLSEKLCDVAAKNAVINAILAVSWERASDGVTYSPGVLPIAIIYPGTPEGSLARELMADMWTSVKTDYIVRHKESLPRDFFIDLALAHSKDRPTDKLSAARRAKADRYLEKTE